jgi:hypothetical protein
LAHGFWRSGGELANRRNSARDEGKPEAIPNAVDALEIGIERDRIHHEFAWTPAPPDIPLELRVSDWGPAAIVRRDIDHCRALEHGGLAAAMVRVAGDNNVWGRCGMRAEVAQSRGSDTVVPKPNRFVEDSGRRGMRNEKGSGRWCGRALPDEVACDLAFSVKRRAETAPGRFRAGDVRRAIQPHNHGGAQSNGPFMDVVDLPPADECAGRWRIVVSCDGHQTKGRFGGKELEVIGRCVRPEPRDVVAGVDNEIKAIPRRSVAKPCEHDVERVRAKIGQGEDPIVRPTVGKRN